MPPRRRDVSATPDTTRPKRHHRLTRAGGRFGVLAALVGVTVVVPVSQTALADSGIASPFEARVALPSTLDALTATPPSQQPPASLVSAAGTETKVDLAKVSRSVWRSPLEGCTGERPADAGQFQNGLLPASALCTLFDGHTQMRADAAVNLAELNEAYVARFGADLCLSSGYRTLAQQRSVKAEKGGLAATPGKSNHGWGLAIDFCSKETTGERWTWLNENAPLYDFENPSWARDGGSGPHERWHWEYLKGVIEDGEYYG
jgi:hypothetical protein